MGNSATRSDTSDSSEGTSGDYSNLDQYINRPAATMYSTPSTSDFSLDAAITTNTLRIKPITSAQNQTICKYLDVNEKISFVYLLAKDYNTALETMIKLTKDAKVFEEFLINYCKKTMFSERQIIEALCVIQNYEVLKLLGYDRQQLEIDFSPLVYHVTVYIKKMRKLCYRVMENFNQDEEANLVQAIKSGMTANGHIVANYYYLEIYFAFMFVEKYITDTDLSDLVKHFKELDMYQYVEILKPAMQQSPYRETRKSEDLQQLLSSGQVNTDKTTAHMGNDVVSGPSGSSHTKVKSDSSDMYPMDPDNPGLVLIIENINFFEDFDEKNKDLVIRSETALEEREGSMKDSERLMDIFGRFGYDTIYKKDRKHDQMLEEIINVTHTQIKKEHSSFILILLSHGEENQIIGCNSIPLDVERIKENINSKLLEGKPKILIMQACQGKEILAIEANDDVSTDAPGASRPMQSSMYPWQQHIFEYWSTVPGYVSFRSRSKGTWMIQTLCDVLESPLRRESFSDICTEVNRRISEKTVDFRDKKCCVMVTVIKNNTLTKKFILPPLRE